MIFLEICKVNTSRTLPALARARITTATTIYNNMDIDMPYLWVIFGNLSVMWSVICWVMSRLSLGNLFSVIFGLSLGYLLLRCRLSLGYLSVMYSVIFGLSLGLSLGYALVIFWKIIIG